MSSTLLNKLKPSKSKPDSLGTEDLIRVMLKKHRSPLMIIRRSVLERQLELFRKCLPDVVPYYAIKANPHPEIIKAFVELGTSFDVASGWEMKEVLRLGGAANRIIFANTIKNTEDISSARKRRVRLMTFDNEPELYKIAEHFRGAHVLLRIKVNNYGSTVNLSLKFGADPENAFPLLRKAKSLGLVPQGISFHVGSQAKNVENYLQALEITAGIFNECQDKGIELKTVDLGGGFPIQHFENESGINFERMASQIRRQMRRLFDEKVQFIAEPGRFMVATACSLVTKINGKAIRDGKTCYYLDDGVYHTFSGQVFDHQKYPLRAFKEGELKVCATFGPTCDAFDTISVADELPEDLQIDDLLYAENIGAYTNASSTFFNGFKPAKIVHINREKK